MRSWAPLGVVLSLLGVAGLRAQRAGQTGWVRAAWSTERDGAEADGSRPMPVFRRIVTLPAGTTHVELRIAGLGQWQARVDGGEPVGGAGLHGDWTDYRKRVRFRSYDLTAALSPGEHTLQVELGNGMYNVQRSPFVGPDGKKRQRYTKFTGSFGPPELWAELRVTGAGGRVTTVGTDARWQVAHGGTRFSSTYGGEDFDARVTPADWNPAVPVDGPGGRLEPAVAPEMVVAGRHLPATVRTLPNGHMVYDLGQNFAGWVRVRVRGARGEVLRLVPGELLNPDGSVSQRSSGGPMWWSYTLRGDTAGESWQPRFGYYGFRYVEAQWTGTGSILELTGESLASDSASVGTFESSDPELNAIHTLILNAMHNNEASILTDCPHREKLGWLEETHLVGAGLMWNNDVDGLYRATAENVEDAQAGSGMVPTTAPQYTRFGPAYAVYDDSPEWGSAAVLAAWKRFQFYGDEDELRREYPVMQGWMRYLRSRAVDGIVAYGLGDWYDVGPGAPGMGRNTTLGVTGTLMLVECAQRMEEIARRLGFAADAEGYRELVRTEAAAFDRRFWNPAHGWYDTGSQTANAMPLALGIVQTERQAIVLRHVVEDIAAHGDHTTSGEVGWPYLLRALEEGGRADVVLRMLRRQDGASYGAELRAGATAETEAWDADPANSQDHFMLGAAEEWFYSGLGGLHVDLSRQGADRLLLRPETPAGLEWLRVRFRSRLGMVRSEWHRSADQVVWTVEVPVPSTVVLPDGTREVVGAGRREFRWRAP